MFGIVRDVFGNVVPKGRRVYVVTTNGKPRRFMWRLDAEQCVFALRQEHIPYEYNVSKV